MAKKKKQKTVAQLKKECQILFNAYIRKRDESRPCISCSRNRPLQAGHYWAVKMYDNLRFNEDNCHGECAGCNCFDVCHLISYTENLKERIGIERYRALCDEAAEYKRNGHKWTRSELQEKIEYYKEKLK